MSYPKTPSKSASHKTPHKTPRRPNAAREEVQVFGRLRPLRSSENGPCVRVVGKTDMVLVAPEGSSQYGRKAQHQHSFQRAFGAGSSQKEVFEEIGLPLVQDLLNTKNGLLFAYGITGSGKTHTMTGEPQDPGILPRCLDVIFNSIQHLQAKKYTFMSNGKNSFEINTEAQAERERRRLYPGRNRRRHEETSVADTVRIPDSIVFDDVDPDSVYGVVVSFVEIFNDYVFDLLEDAKPDKDMRDKGPQSKRMREDTGRHQMYVSDVTEVPVTSTEEAYEQLVKGQKKRRVAHTQLNHESSRSHSIFNIRLIRAPLDEAGKSVLLNADYLRVSQLSLVDLAGSERAVRTQNVGERLREAGNINQSLMVLRTCLECLRDNQNKPPEQQKIVPYRDSKITQLFKNFFEGDGKVRMIICCSSSNSDFDEMLHVMKFAEVTQEVTVARSQAVKFDIPGLAAGRRQINNALEAMADGRAPSSDSLPFSVEVAPAPDSPYTGFATFIDTFEGQTTQFEAGCQYVVRGMDAFKSALIQAMGAMTSNDALARANENLERINQDLVYKVDDRDQKLNHLIQIVKSNSAEEEKRRVRHEQRHEQAMHDAEEERRRARKEEEHRLALLENTVPQTSMPEPMATGMSPMATAMSPRSPQVAGIDSPDKENAFGHGGSGAAPLYTRKRRSDEKWLEHKPEGTLQTDTVLQPKLKKSKTVTIPKKSDMTSKNYGRYMLHHQEEDSIGEVKEQLFKGAMMKTRGGGMSVQFTDVETLQQRRPEQLRRSECSPVKPLEPTAPALEADVDVPERCATAFEGRPGMMTPSVAHRVTSGR
ncbi:kinesin-like protein KIF23 isoform X2 [Sycon ciliatum]|uniref:kinesin-like protein KIF23 isoform X2 n=1 Tax=Sycon ciliatum TaxID=27933 RepID=UPI0031F652B5